MKGYISVCEVSYKWNVLEPGVNQYCQEGRIAGLSRFGKSWCIPEDEGAHRPAKRRADQRQQQCHHICHFFFSALNSLAITI